MIWQIFKIDGEQFPNTILLSKQQISSNHDFLNASLAWLYQIKNINLGECETKVTKSFHRAENSSFLKLWSFLALTKKSLHILKTYIFLEFWITRTKGHLISKCLFAVSSILPKNERKILTLLLWYLKSNCFRSFFGRIEIHQKDISKLTDL